jgi:hypothetical protein
MVRAAVDTASVWKGSGLHRTTDQDQVKQDRLWFYEPRNRCRSIALSPQQFTPDSPTTVGQPIFQFDLSFGQRSSGGPYDKKT